MTWTICERERVTADGLDTTKLTEPHVEDKRQSLEIEKDSCFDLLHECM